MGKGCFQIPQHSSTNAGQSENPHTGNKKESSSPCMHYDKVLLYIHWIIPIEYVRWLY